MESTEAKPTARHPPETPPRDLPLALSTFVGREREIAEAKWLLAHNRLLTLTGPGGSGKTRLALAVAEGVSGSFEGGVFFVSLAAITEPALVAPTVAQVLESTGGGDRTPEELLKGYLRERLALLLLDNFEQVLGGASLVGELLSAAPGLKVLATSRAPLKLHGEQEYPVPPLRLPGPKALEPPERLARYEAVRLFAERARAVEPGFCVTEQNAPAVAEICARLDGLPLAIELAAARIRLLPPEAMVGRLGSRLKLLGGGARNAPERQRTLRSALEWSHDLLIPEERKLFARLSVFSGGRTLEAMEAVCDPEAELDVIGGVESLLEKNLLAREEGAGGEPRFVMLETVHEYAREKLEESEDAETVMLAHAEYFVAMAEEAEPELRGPKEAEWLNRLEVEHDNLRAALYWALGGGDADLGLRLVGTLGEFWQAKGYYGEARSWLEKVLAKEERGSAEARAKALLQIARTANLQGDQEKAEAAAQEGLALSQKAGLGAGIGAEFRRRLGITARMRGDHERATRLFEEALELARDAGEKPITAWALLSLANMYSDLGKRERALELYEEGLDLSKELGGSDLLGSFLISLGYEHLLEGDHERATVLNEQAANLYRKRGHKAELTYALDNLGWAALVRGDYQRAWAMYEECLQLCKELGDKLVAADTLEGLACLLSGYGGVERAARLFGAAEALRETAGDPNSPMSRYLREPYLTSSRLRLGEASWQRAWEEGQKVTFEEAVDYALSTREPHMLPSAASGHPPSSKPDHPAGLTAREVEVLKLVTEGMTNARIAQELYLSPRTVHRHLNRIYHKLGTNSRASAARFAVEHGLLR